MPDVKWIKLLTSLPDDEKIKTIELMPERYAVFYVWIMLLIQAGKCNDGGYIYLADKMPYQEEQLANQFNMQPNILKLALAVFQRLKMLELGDDGLIFIPNFAKHQNIKGLEQIRETTRLRVAKYRGKQKQKLLTQGEEVTLRNATVTLLEEETEVVTKETTKKKIENIEEDKNKKQNTRSLFPLIKLTKEELLKLTEKYGQGEAEKRIEALSLYKQSTGKKYKSDFATILNWDRMDAEKTKPKPDKYLNQGKYDNLVCRTADDVERIRKLRDSIEGKKEDAKQQPANQ